MNAEKMIKIRRDGQIITEEMSVADIAALGWPPEEVVRLEWLCAGEKKAIENPFGIIARYLPDRSGIAVLHYEDASNVTRRLDVWDADGSLRFSRDAHLLLDGVMLHGYYGWFEPSRSGSTNVLGVIFSPDADRSMFHLDLDTHSGEVVGVFRAR